MVNLIGTIVDAKGTGLTGILTLQLDQPVKVENMVATIAPAEFDIISGIVDINIIAVDNIRIKFTIGDNTYFDFYTDIPNVSPLNISDLIPVTDRDSLHLNILRLASILIDTPEYFSNLNIQFVPRGNWDNTATYSKKDLVTYGGNSYVWKSIISGNSTPSDISTNWQLIAAKGDTGSGTSGSNLAYNSSWSGDLSAPTKNIIYATLEAVFAKKTDYSNLALNTDAALQGTPTAPTPPINNDSQRIATTEFIWGAIEALISPASPTVPYAPDTTLGDNTQKITNNKALMAAINNIGIVKNVSSFKVGTFAIAYGVLTTASVAWTAGTEIVSVISYPDSLTISTTNLVMLANWGASTGATGIVTIRTSTNNTSSFNLNIRTALSVTSAVTVYWFVIGTAL